MRKAPLAMLVSSMSMTSPSAPAAELSGDVSFTGTYNTNEQTRASTDSDEDGYSASVRPLMRLEGQMGARGTYALEYAPTYRYNSVQNASDDLDHQLDVRTTHRLGPTTTLSFRHGLSVLRDLLRESPGEAVADDIFRRERRIANSSSLSLLQVFGPKLSGTLQGAYTQLDTSDDRRSDARSWGANANLSYRLTARDSVGAGVSASFQEFEGIALESDGGGTDFYSVQGSWTHSFTDTLSLSMSAGPLFVFPTDPTPQVLDLVAGQSTLVNQFPTRDDRVLLYDTCPTIDGVAVVDIPFPRTPGNFLSCDTADTPVALADTGAPRSLTGVPFIVATANEPATLIESTSSADSTTLSTAISLSKRWRNSRGSLSYRRRAGDVSTLGQSTVSDIVSANFAWEPSEKWRATFSAAWTKRSATTDDVRLLPVVAVEVVPQEALDPPGLRIARSTQNLRLIEIENPVSTNSDSTFRRAEMTVTRQMTRNIVTALSVAWRDQEFDNQSIVRGREDYESYTVSFRFSYRFLPMRIPLPGGL